MCSYFAGKTPLSLAQNKPGLLELLKDKIKVEDEEDANSFNKLEISKLLNDSDNSDQIEVKNIDLQVFKPKKNHIMYSSHCDFDTGDLINQNDNSEVQQDNRRKRHVSEGNLDGKIRLGGTLHSSHSSSLDILPRIDEVDLLYFTALNFKAHNLFQTNYTVFFFTFWVCFFKHGFR